MTHPGRDGIDLNPIIVIDEHTFKMQLLTPSRAFEIGAKLMRLMGEPIATLAGSENANGFKDALPQAVKALTANLDKGETLMLIKQLMSTLSIEGKLVNFDVYFHGQMGLMFKVLTQVIELQFSDFFEGVAQALTKVTNIAKAS